MTNYRNANTTAQWFQDTHPGADLRLRPETMVLVLHTTEGASWPGYEGGATAPNYTGKPNFRAKWLDWRAHFPDEKSSRALRNLAGGVETNTLNAVQVELIGTCDPAKRKSWGSLRANEDYIFWPEAPAWALQSLARFIADMHKRHGLRLTAPEFLPYPASYGNSPARFSFEKWRNFTGICGHQHVPENSHGDPGSIDIGKVLEYVDELVNPPKFTVTYGERVPGQLGDVHVGPRQHVVGKKARLRLKGTLNGVTWTRVLWHRHRFCVVSWEDFTRSERLQIREVTQAAQKAGYDVLLVGRPGTSKIFTPKRLYRRLGLRAVDVWGDGGLSLGLPPHLRVESRRVEQMLTLEVERAQ